MNEGTKRHRLSWKTWVALRDELEGLGVCIPEQDGVQYYLDDHTDMLDAVRDWCRLTREEFGSEGTLTLEWEEEPGVPEGCLRLLLRLPSYQGDRLIVDRFGDIHERAAALGHDERSGSIYLTTDFKKPRCGNAI